MRAQASSVLFRDTAADNTVKHHKPEGRGQQQKSVALLIPSCKHASRFHIERCNAMLTGIFHGHTGGFHLSSSNVSPESYYGSR